MADTPTPDERHTLARRGLSLAHAAIKAAAAGQPFEGMPENGAIRAACARLRDSAAPCDCRFDAALPLIPCLTAIGLAAQEAGVPAHG